MKELLVIICLGCLLQACGTLRHSPKYQLADDVYEYRQKGTNYQKAFLYVEEDTMKILLPKEPYTPIIPRTGEDQFFLKRSFDIDVMTVAFKYRPAVAYLPRQLDTDFNGNVFIGYRLDRFRIKVKNTPVGLRKSFSHRGITLGGFGGIGSSSVTPWTTNNQTFDEYNAFIISRGLAIMIGVNHLTVGVGVGWDYLTDRDKDIWIYQNKPWYGLTVGLNLN
ncbi:hypothetical protein [Chryseolinea sp. H1M3-3]|uniref:hypothetical protein n=1 Tax=Chryseolinea sp. H1M3-3 TaxID=3034144 RepID=UPI0023ECB98D|nr:hypothetical protein [Chryseolinea sp. H1M3-3]